jgi:hypothetical protein
MSNKPNSICTIKNCKPNSICTLDIYTKKIQEVGIYLHLNEDFIEKIIQQHVREDNSWLTHLTPFGWVQKRLDGLIEDWDCDKQAPKINF